MSKQSLKDFFGGKSIFSYSGNKISQNVGRIMEHVDTKAVGSATSRIGHVQAKYDRTVHELIGEEYHNFEVMFSAQIKIINEMAHSVDEKKELLKRWYIEISRGALSDEAKRIKDYILTTFHIIETGITMVGELRDDFKDARADFTNYQRLVDKHLAALDKLMKQLNDAVDDVTHATLSSRVKKAGGIDKRDDKSISETQRNQDDIYKKLKIVQESLKRLHAKSGNLKDKASLIKLIQESADEIIDSLKRLWQHITEVQSIAIRYELVTPSLGEMLTSTDRMFDEIKRLSHSLNMELNLVGAIAANNRQVSDRAAELQRKAQHVANM